MKRLIVSALLVAGSITSSFAQINRDTTDLTFTGTKVNPYRTEFDSTGKLSFSGYIDTYYGFYTDTVGAGGFVKFPTVSARNNQFGLNMIQFSTKYESNDFHGTATVFIGDVSESAWSPTLKYVQEANVGFRVFKKLWLDAGYFRTHIGLESIQPRENMALSIATTTYFEPYFMSGAKLTWIQSPKWSFQLNAFNGFNSFVENNANKALGASISYAPNDKFSSTFSSLVCDESPDGFNRPQTRLYNNWIGIYKTTHWTVGYELNYGFQTNSQLTDSSKTAQFFSTLLAAKYRLDTKWASYTRFELFEDGSEVLTGPIENANHQLVGLDITGFTLGMEYKPIPNSYFRLEGRVLSTKANEDIFYYNSVSRNQRLEVLFGLGVWF